MKPMQDSDACVYCGLRQRISPLHRFCQECGTVQFKLKLKMEGEEQQMRVWVEKRRLSAFGRAAAERAAETMW